MTIHVHVPTKPQGPRLTSYEAGLKILDSLPEKRGYLFESLLRLGGAGTAEEVRANMQGPYRPSRNNASKLLGDMARGGVLRENGVRKCTISDNYVIEYVITGKMPGKVSSPRKPSYKQLEATNARLLERVGKLESENAKLRRALDSRKPKGKQQLRLPLGGNSVRPFG